MPRGHHDLTTWGLAATCSALRLRVHPLPPRIAMADLSDGTYVVECLTISFGALKVFSSLLPSPASDIVEQAQDIVAHLRVRSVNASCRTSHLTHGLAHPSQSP